MQRLLSLFLLLAGSAACGGPAPPRSDVELAVYAALLDSLYSSAPTQRLLLEPMTAGPLVSPGDLARAGVEPALAADFVRANLQAERLTRPPPTRLPVLWDTLPPLTHEERDAIQRKGEFRGGFERVQRAYPGVTGRVGSRMSGSPRTAGTPSSTWRTSATISARAASSSPWCRSTGVGAS